MNKQAEIKRLLSETKSSISNIENNLISEELTKDHCI